MVVGGVLVPVAAFVDEAGSTVEAGGTVEAGDTVEAGSAAEPELCGSKCVCEWEEVL